MNTSVIRMRERDVNSLDRGYLYCFLRSDVFQSQVIQYAIGAAQANFGPSHLKRMFIPVPPLPTQRKIASILSAYDDLIENNTRRVQVLEDMARALYREWFVEYRYPGHEDAEFIEDEKGRRPADWDWVKVGDRVELLYGKALKADERKPGPYPVYGSGGVVGWHSLPLSEGPGVIVGRKGNVGAVYWSDDPFFPIDTVYYVRSNLPLHYLYFNLQGQNFINNDAAVPGLNRNQAYSLPLLVPDELTLSKFAAFVGDLFENLKNLRNRSANLRRTRDLLLPKLVSGELDVSALDIQGVEEQLQEETA